MARKKMAALPLPQIYSIILDQATAVAWCDMLGITRKSVPRNKLLCIEDDLRRGHWRADAYFDPFIFGKKKKGAQLGPLYNGKTRLLAVAETGISMPIYYVEDWTPDTVLFSDIVTPTTLASILSARNYGKKAVHYTNTLVTLAYLRARTELNHYTLSASVKKNGRAHASLTDARITAEDNMDDFIRIAAKAREMAKQSTSGKGEYAYARFICLMELYGSKAHKKELAQFCDTFASDPDADLHTKAARDVIMHRISQLKFNATLDPYWVIGVLLKALDQKVNGLSPAMLDKNTKEMKWLEQQVIVANQQVGTV